MLKLQQYIIKKNKKRHHGVSSSSHNNNSNISLTHDIATLFIQVILISCCLILLTHTGGIKGDDIPVWTRAYDNFRTNANLRETELNTGNVSKEKFGKLFSRTVEGHVYAQVLYIPDLYIPKDGKKRNVMYVATMANNVYAFDADDPDANEPIWWRNFGNPLPIHDAKIGAPSAHCAVYTDIHVEVGIVSTPVIDQSTNTMYLMATNKDSHEPYVVHHRLHAIDIATGQSRPNSPVVIEGQYPGTGDGSVNGIITFTSLTQNQRLSLTLVDDTIYFAFGSYCTMPIYHGWLFGYDKISLTRKLIWCTTPSMKEGSIWQSGVGLIYEKPYLYMISANGYWKAGSDWGNSYLKVDPRKVNSNGLLIDGVVDYFTPYNWEELFELDLDLGTAGPLFIPGTDCLFGCSKQGWCYVVNKNDMGKHSETENLNLQYFKPNPNSGTDYPTLTMGTHGALTAWKTADKTRVYVWPNFDVLKAFNFIPSGNNARIGTLDLTNVEEGPTIEPGVGFPGGMLSLSANGADTSTGILWAFHSIEGSANREIRSGIIRAYDANDITKELWNSNQVPCRDAVGNVVKFSQPVVSNGKMFLPSMPDTPNRMSKISVYGLLNAEQASKTYVYDACCIANRCGVGIGCCGGACFDANMYYCSNHALCQKGQTCDANSPDPCLTCPNSCCFGKCYDKSKQVCSKNVWICDIGKEACADKCYDPKEFTCVNDYPVPVTYLPPRPGESVHPYPSPKDSPPVPGHSSGPSTQPSNSDVGPRRSAGSGLVSGRDTATSLYLLTVMIGLLAVVAFFYSM